MKKVLFGTTAIVAAAFAGQALANGSVQHDDGVTLSIGGYFIAGVGVGPFSERRAEHVAGNGGTEYAGALSGDDLEKDFHIINDGEIHFKAKGTLDNGIGIEVRVELEAFNETGDYIDETWMKIKTAFGTVLVGADDTAVDAVVGGLGRMGGGIAGGSWDTGRTFAPGASSYHLGDDGDGYGIHYYSPNISGFEFGVSWQPDNDDTDGPNDCGSTTGISTNCSTTNSNDQITAAASYSGNLGDIDFAIGGGYVTFERDTAGGIRSEVTAWGGGVELGFGAITVGAAGLVREDDDWSGAATLAGAETELTQYGAGIEYVNGPWVFGLSGMMHEVDENATAGNHDFEAYLINAAVGYELAKGVDFGVGVDYGEVDFDTAGQDDQEGFGAKMLLGVKF